MNSRPRRQRILFLQLPRLDNDVSGLRENLPMAGFYLHHSLKRSGAAPGAEARFLSPQEELLDDAHLLRLVREWQPHIVCATLYLWNVERTLDLLRKVKTSLPSVTIIAGGPEVSFHHPFLLRTAVPDVVVVGEGEGVFPEILKSIRSGTGTNLAGVAWRKGRRYEWGRAPRPLPDLGHCLPPPGDPGWGPDAYGTAYLETGRGCPMRCTYCRYPHLRERMSFLTPTEIAARVRTLRDRGAGEIRLVDPTFNAHPFFLDVLKSLRREHGPGGLRFFAELRAETLSPLEIALLPRAGFSEVEVGVQSRDPRVLRRIRRPLLPVRLEGNLRRMISEGVQVTLDLMYGLPGQRSREVIDSLRWAKDLGPAHLQCLQTLLIPGTALRRDRRKWHIRADDIPPYGVRSTDSLSWDEIREIEERIHGFSPTDCMTRRFVGHHLPDLFPERIQVHLTGPPAAGPVGGCSARRALLFRDDDLFSHRENILRIVRQAVLSEAHILWQFVFMPAGEFPLDLLDAAVRQIREFPSLWTDRFASVAGWDRVASRRVFVLLRRGHRYPNAWVRNAERLLEDHFF